ncbi:MAG: glycosyltransferase family 10 domain-containing protein [Phycisphaerae bacterium]
MVRQEHAGIAIKESDISGKRFVYRAGGRRSMRLTLRADHRLEGAPSINEHSWAIENGKLVLRHRDGHPTVELITSDGEHFAGTDLTTSPPEKARLSPDWRTAFGPLNALVREIRYAIRADKRPAPLMLSRAVLMENSVAVRFGSKTIRWIFPFAGVKRFMAQAILPWALPGCAVLSGDAPTDFVIGVYLNDATITESFSDLPGQKFLLSVEKETRHPKIADCHSFVQNPQPGDDAAYIRYAPTFCCWVPPRDTAKTRKCSVVDNGQYAWRIEMIGDLARRIGDVDIFGRLSGRPLGGYHRSSDSTFGNDKYQGIENHCFYLSLERAVADDYITEKFTDAILCDAVPIYDGAGNIDVYSYPEAYIRTSDVGNIDWNNWQAEYDRRLPAVQAQKELIRTRLNVFSYFHLLTEDLSLLDKIRPMTR